MNELNPFEQDLADRLDRQAQAVDIGDTPMAFVVRRGQQRHGRRRVAVGVAAVLTLSATAIGTIQLLSKPVSHRVAPATDSVGSDESTLDGTVASDALTPVTRVASNLVWNAVEPDSSEALGGTNFFYPAAFQAQPPYLAWSTAPGRVTDPNKAYLPQLWRSDDGIHWKLAGDATFTQPEVQSYGLGSRNGRLFAFGTAAATAPIPKGGGGDVVVDVSDDQGASWRPIVLPVDLRGLSEMAGVQSAGFSGSFAVGADSVVAVAAPYPNFSASVYDRMGGSFAISREGLTPLDYPTCGRDAVTATTVAGVAAPGVTSPADTIVAGTTTTVVGPVATALAVAVDSTGCTADTTPQQGTVVPWSELGVDSHAVDAMFAPQVFVSTDGENFEEGSFPPPPDGYTPGTLPKLFATQSGFVGIAQFYSGTGQRIVTKLYASADGLTWSETDTPLDQINSLEALPDGTLLAFGQDATPYPNSQTWVASSPDGVEWTKLSMSGLLEPSDGTTAMLNVSQTASGPSGITVMGSIDVDAAAEAGGFSIEKDGVRLSLTDSRYNTMIATDIATGDELGRIDGRTPPKADASLANDPTGGISLRNADGTVRVVFSSDDMNKLYVQNIYSSKQLILHSTDGINWSRDDVEPLAGFDTFGGGRIQVTENNVLVSVVKATQLNSDGTPTDPGSLPKTVVLVGTPKS